MGRDIVTDSARQALFQDHSSALQKDLLTQQHFLINCQGQVKCERFTSLEEKPEQCIRTFLTAREGWCAVRCKDYSYQLIDNRFFSAACVFMFSNTNLHFSSKDSLSHKISLKWPLPLTIIMTLKFLAVLHRVCKFTNFMLSGGESRTLSKS